MELTKFDPFLDWYSKQYHQPLEDIKCGNQTMLNDHRAGWEAALQFAAKPEYFYTDEMAGDYDYLADCEDLEEGKLMKVTGARSVGEYWIACINNRHKLFKTKDEAELAIDNKDDSADGGL